MNILHPRIGLGLILALLLAAAASAGPPTVDYLTPDSYTLTAGQAVTLRIQQSAAPDAPAAQWPADEIAWFYVLGPGTRENRDTLPAAPADQKQAQGFPVETPGVNVIGVDLKPRVEEMSGAELQAFLLQNTSLESDDAAVVRLPRQAKIRVRRIKSATALVTVNAADGTRVSRSAALNKTGQRVEIRPLFDPTQIPVGSDLPVRVYVKGSKEVGAKVQARPATEARAAARETDSAGATYFTIPSTGVWRIEFHHAEPLANDLQADWVLYSATLTFEVAQKEAAK